MPPTTRMRRDGKELRTKTGVYGLETIVGGVLWSLAKGPSYQRTHMSGIHARLRFLSLVDAPSLDATSLSPSSFTSQWTSQNLPRLFVLPGISTRSLRQLLTAHRLCLTSTIPSARCCAQ